MKKTRALVAILVAVLALSFCACSMNQQDNDGYVVGSGQMIVPIDTDDLSGGVAAQVDDVQIGENAITAYVNNFRYSNSLQDEGDWGQWLYDEGYSMDSFRSGIVNIFVSQELIRQACEQEGVIVSDDEIDAKISDARGDASDEDYANALDQQGLDEASYRESVKVALLQQKLEDQIVGDNSVDDETLLHYLKVYYPNDIDQNATNYEGVDQTLVDSVRDRVQSLQSNRKFSDWMSSFRESKNVVTHMMPEGLPYVVDLAPYEEAASEAESTGDNSNDSEDADSSAPADDGNGN